MKKTVSNYAFQNYSLPSRRFLVSLFDAFLLALSSFLLLLLTMNVILPNIPSYQKKVNDVEDYRIAMVKISEEADISTYTNNADGKYNSPDSLGDMFKRYAAQHILRSYEEEPSKWELTPELEGYSKADFSTDQFAKFYVDYVSKYNDYEGTTNDVVNLGGLTNKAYLQHLLKTKDTSYLAWADEAYLGHSVDSEDFLFLKAGFAQNLYLYEFKGEKSEPIASSRGYFYTMYKTIWDNATEELTNSKRFNDTYNLYKDNYVFCTHIASLATVLVYLFCFLIVFMLPMLIFRDRAGTFGYRIFSLAAIDYEKNNPVAWQVVVKLLILFFTNLPALLVASFLSGGLSSSLMFPLFNNGPSLLQILIVTAVLPLVDMFMVSLSHHRRSIAEWASHTVVVDTRKDMVIVQEEKPQEDYTHSNVNMVVTDLPYIDSSTIPEDKIVNEEGGK